MNGVIYSRVSSREQVEGTSLESQEIACRDYAKRNGIQVTKVFVERGESAKFADRTQLLELLEFCQQKQNAVGVLLVWKIDRLSRNVGDHFNIKATLLKHGVRVVSVTEPIDAKPEGKLLETILAGFAQFDNDLRAARTVQGMRKKIQDGIFPWKPPLGYKTPTPPGSKKTGPDVPDQPTFGLLQGIWRDFATGSYGKAEIVRIAASRGLRSHAGLPLTIQSIDHIFRDSFYAGIIKDPWSGEEYGGGHLPLVSREIFERVQRVNSERARSQCHVSIRAEFPLRMFARCSVCNYYVTGGFSRGRSKHYPYYRCANRKCSDVMYSRTERVHEEFRTYLSKIAPQPKDIEFLTESIAVAIRDRTRTWSELAGKREREAKKLEDQLQQLIQMRAEKLITDDEFVAHRAVISKRQASQERLPVKDFVNDANGMLANLTAITQPLRDLSKTWATLTPELQQRFQRSILPAGFAVGQIGTADMSCLFSFFQASKGTKSNVVPPTGQSWNQLEKELLALAGLF